VSKKQLPKRTLSFKLEKHPTAERLENLRAQGIENLDDLDRLSNETTTINTAIATTTETPTAIPTAISINESQPSPIFVDPSVAIDGSKPSSTDDKPNVGIADRTKTKEIPKLSSKENPSFKSSKTSLIDNVYPIPKDIVNYIDSDIISHIDSSIDIPIVSPIDIPIPKPIVTPIITPIETSTLTPDELFSQVQETHSVSAQIIYQLMYELATGRSKQTLRIGTKELLEKTQIKSHVTIRKAIDELQIKCSLQIVEPNQGKIPPVYKLIPPEKIFSEREQKGLIIDEDTKFVFQANKRIWPNNGDKIIGEAIPLHTTSAIDKPTSNHISKTTLTTTSSNTNPSIEADPTALTTRINELTGICQQLGVIIADSPRLIQLTNYPISHIIIGICKKVEQVKDSVPVTIVDCLPEISDHYQSMGALPESILAKVAYDYFLRLKENT